MIHITFMIGVQVAGLPACQHASKAVVVIYSTFKQGFSWNKLC